MGLTDGHLAWGDDIPTESEKEYRRQIDNLEKENARLKNLEDAVSSINESIASLIRIAKLMMKDIEDIKKEEKK